MLKIGNTKIKVIQGDITEQDTEAIVNAANNKLILGGGVAGAIKRKGGISIQQECNKIGQINVGDAAITSAGNLKSKYVIHAATMDMSFKTDETKIRNATKNSLKFIKLKKIKSISFPALGCGVGGFPYNKAAQIMYDELKKYIEENPDTCLEEVRFVLFENEAYKVFSDVIGEKI